MPPALSGIEVPSIEQDQHGPLFRAVRVELCSRWPAGHSPHVFTGCSRTPARPLLARCSRAPSRPRAPVRLLQMNVPTSTTEDRSNIPNHRNPWLGRLPGSTEGLPSIEGNRRRCEGSGVENTESRRSPPRLLATETSPRPRALRAPPVADTRLFPVWRDAGRDRCRRRDARLHGTRRVRVVRRRTSAKRSGVHQPEGPSVAGPFAMRTGMPAGGSKLRPARFHAFFTTGRPCEGRSHRTRRLGLFGRGRVAEHPLVRRTAAPPTTSAFE